MHLNFNTMVVIECDLALLGVKGKGNNHCGNTGVNLSYF